MQMLVRCCSFLLPLPACAPMHEASYASLGKATHALLSGGWCVERRLPAALRVDEGWQAGSGGKNRKVVARLGRSMDDG
jgi:hypothetical protein